MYIVTKRVGYTFTIIRFKGNDFGKILADMKADIMLECKKAYNISIDLDKGPFDRAGILRPDGDTEKGYPLRVGYINDIYSDDKISEIEWCLFKI